MLVLLMELESVSRQSWQSYLMLGTATQFYRSVDARCVAALTFDAKPIHLYRSTTKKLSRCSL